MLGRMWLWLLFIGLVAKSGAWSVCVKEYTPFAEKTNGKWHGLSIDIIQELARRMREPFFIVDAPESTVASQLEQVKLGHADMAMTAITVTRARLAQVDFSRAHTITGLRMVAPRMGSILELSSLSLDDTVGVQAGAPSVTFFERRPNLARIRVFDDLDQAFQALLDKSVDAVVGDAVPVKQFSQRNPNDFRLSAVFDEQTYAVAFRKGAMLNWNVSDQILGMWEDGTIADYESRYFDLFAGTPYATPKTLAASIGFSVAAIAVTSATGFALLRARTHNAEKKRKLDSYQTSAATVAASPPIAGLFYDYVLCVAPGGGQSAYAANIRTGQIAMMYVGHYGRIVSLLVFEDGTMFTGSEDMSVRSWNIKSGNTLQSWKFTSSVVELTARDHNLFVATAEGKIQQIDLRSKAVIRALAMGQSGIQRVSCGRRHVVGQAWDGTTMVWDSRNGRVEGRFTGQPHGAILDAHVLFHIGATSTEKLETGSYIVLQTFHYPANPSGGTRLIMLRDGFLFVLCDRSIIRFCTTTGEDEPSPDCKYDMGDVPVQKRSSLPPSTASVLAGAKGQVLVCMHIDEDCRRIYAGTNDGIVVEWDVVSAKQTAVFLVNAYDDDPAIRGLLTSDNCLLVYHRRTLESFDRYAVASTNTTVRTPVCEIRSATLMVSSLEIDSGTPSFGGPWRVRGQAAFSTSSSRRNPNIMVWDTLDGQAVGVLPAHKEDSTVTCLCVHSESRLLYSGAPLSGVQIWDLDTGRRVRHEGRALSLLPGSPPLELIVENEKLYVAGSASFFVFPTGTELRGPVEKEEFETDEVEEIRPLFKLDYPQRHPDKESPLIYRRAKGPPALSAVAFQGRLCVCATSTTSTVEQYDTEIGVWGMPYRTPTTVNVMSLAASSAYLCGGTRDWTVVCWAWGTREQVGQPFEAGEPVWVLRGHTAPVTCMHSNGSFLFSASSDDTIVRWNMTALKHRESQRRTRKEAARGMLDRFMVHQSSPTAMIEHNGILYSASVDIKKTNVQLFHRYGILSDLPFMNPGVDSTLAENEDDFVPIITPDDNSCEGLTALFYYYHYSFSNIGIYIGSLLLFIVEFLQISSFAFSSSIEWGAPEIATAMTQVRTFGIMQAGFRPAIAAASTLVWALFFLFAGQEWIEKKAFRDPNSNLYFYMWYGAMGMAAFLSRMCFVSVFGVLLDVFFCAELAPGVYGLVRDPSILCFRGEHVALATISFVSAVVYCAMCVRLSMVNHDLSNVEVRLNPFDWSGDAVKFRQVARHPLDLLSRAGAKFSTASQWAKVFLSVITTVFFDAVLVSAGGLLVALYLVGVTFVFKPYPSHLFTRIRWALDWGIVWVYCSSLVAIQWEGKRGSAPIVLLCVVFVVVFIFGYSAMATLQWAEGGASGAEIHRVRARGDGYGRGRCNSDPVKCGDTEVSDPPASEVPRAEGGLIANIAALMQSMMPGQGLERNATARSRSATPHLSGRPRADSGTSIGSGSGSGSRFGSRGLAGWSAADADRHMSGSTGSGSGSKRGRRGAKGRKAGADRPINGSSGGRMRSGGDSALEAATIRDVHLGPLDGGNSRSPYASGVSHSVDDNRRSLPNGRYLTPNGSTMGGPGRPGQAKKRDATPLAKLSTRERTGSWLSDANPPAMDARLLNGRVSARTLQGAETPLSVLETPGRESGSGSQSGDYYGLRPLESSFMHHYDLEPRYAQADGSDESSEVLILDSSDRDYDDLDSYPGHYD